MRISDWSSDVCSSDLDPRITLKNFISETGIELEDIYSGTRSWSELLEAGGVPTLPGGPSEAALRRGLGRLLHTDDALRIDQYRAFALAPVAPVIAELDVKTRRLFHMLRSEEHTSELQSLMRISYAVFCLK